MSNLKLAFRRLIQTPFVTLVAVVSLGLGIGANTAIFSMFNEVLLRPLPVQAPDQLVNLGNPGPKPGSTSCGQPGNCDVVFSYAMFRDLERLQTVFSGVAGHVPFGANLAYRGRTESSTGLLVSGSYFPVLGVRPALGRLLGPDDDRAVGGLPVAVLSHEYWTMTFGADPAVLNDTMVVNGQALTIVGVGPRGFRGTTFGLEPAVFVPVTLRELMSPGWKGFENRRSYWLYLFARLKPEVSIEQARMQMNGIYRPILADVEAPLQTGMSDQTMARFLAKEITLEGGWRGQSSVHTGAKTPLVMLMSITGLVLLIACANIANLLLARGAGRSTEMAVRLSLGASRRQLLAQLLTESTLLAVLGGAAGIIAAYWTLQSIAAMLPAMVTRSMAFALDRTAIGFTIGLALATGIVFGIVPALHSTRPQLASTLKAQAGQPSGARAAAFFRRALVVTQVAMSMALLATAGLFVKSLANVSRVDLGLNVDNVVTFRLSPLLSGYTPARAGEFYLQAEDRLAVIPGVTGVTASMVPLLSGSNWGNDVSVEGFERGPDTDANSRYNEVGPGYFRTMGIPLVVGREFTAADAGESPRVAIVNETFAKKFNLGTNAVGKRMATGSTAKLDIEIVGLVQNAKYSAVKQEIPPLYFVPYRQNAQLGSMSFYVRTGLDPEALLRTVQGTIAELDPQLPVQNLRTMPQQVRENVFLDRMISTLSAAFAILATVLAAVGLYGVLAYTVMQRTREFGLRMALGADGSRVRRLVLRQVGWMTLIGGSVGLLAAVGLGRLAESLLYEMSGYDLLAFGGAAIALTAVAFAAGYVPARRASRVDPMSALRYE